MQLNSLCAHGSPLLHLHPSASSAVFHHDKGLFSVWGKKLKNKGKKIKQLCRAEGHALA